MDQIIRLISSTFRGDDHADPMTDQAGWALSLASKLSVSTSRGSWGGTVASVCPVSPGRTRRVIRLVALIWALIIGHASLAGSLEASEEARASHMPDLAAKVDRVLSGSHTRVAQPEHGPRPRSLKRSGARSKFALWKNPDCDDSTSQDSDDDDDTSNDLNDTDDDNDTDVPISLWVQDLVLYLTFLEIESAPSWTEILSSPFPTHRQLRC